MVEETGTQQDLAMESEGAPSNVVEFKGHPSVPATAISMQKTNLLRALLAESTLAQANLQLVQQTVQQANQRVQETGKQLNDVIVVINAEYGTDLGKTQIIDFQTGVITNLGAMPTV